MKSIVSPRGRSLDLIILAPVLLFLLLAGVSLYFTILKPVDEFVVGSIGENLLSLADGAYGIADRKIDQLLLESTSEDERATLIGQVAVFRSFEDFARQNDVTIVVQSTETNASIFQTESVENAFEIITAQGRSGHISMEDSRAYYFQIRDFSPWQWRIHLLKDASAYSSLLNSSRKAYLATAVILLAIAALLIVYFRRAVAGPINQIVRHLKVGKTPGYKGIHEFEFLSDNVTSMMQSLRDKTLQLESTIENMSDGVVVFDRELRLAAWNQQFVKLNRFPDDLISIGRPYAEIIRHTIERGDYGQGDPEQLLAERVERAKQNAHSRFEVQREEGWLEVSRNPMPGGGFVTTYTDVTERKKAAEELAQHRDRLEELVEARTAELLEVNRRLAEATREMEIARDNAEHANDAKSQFLANISHDLRTPLHHILNYTALVLKHSTDILPVRQYDNLENISSSAQRLLTLIQDILDYTRSEEIHPANVALEPLIDECLQTVEPMLESERVKLVKEVDADLPVLLTDQAKLYRILMNLLSNAAAFTQAGKICLRARRRDGEVDITVMDTGVGIPSDALERIFGEFEQADRSNLRRHGSTGLGLTICRRFSELIDGRITVESEVGVGSAFTLTIPIRLEAEAVTSVEQVS